ncbi:MAG: hypothetical protein II877_02000 [Synergistaceae bacterium]|nr:hypothetical protein [Synergistaceae bacterium]MBQ6971122.1 hypothetical protein [Synergistaceae bacterium]
MLLELMSNGTLAELPPENMPEGISPPGDSSVMLLLPHNKYLLGQHGSEWVYAGGSPETLPQNVFLYDSQSLSLLNDNAEPTILNAGTVNTLRRELLAMSEPPGNHTGAVLMLRTFMGKHPVFLSENAEYLDEKIFAASVRNNPTLIKAYWTLRFAMNRGELEAVTRIKAWLKADPDVFARSGHETRLWFSILEMPDAEAVSELESLSFSVLELKRMAAQNASPVVVYNPVSGWLVLARFGRKRDTMFFLWAYFSHDLWNELRERKKLSVNDIILSSWGEHDTRQAMTERAKYKGADDIAE